MVAELPSLADVESARRRIASVVTRTPLLPLDPSIAGEREIFIKCENLQRTGSFKIRGAYNRIAGLGPDARSRGVVAYSSGNHAQGVACAAALLGVPATIVMPENAVETKVQATRRYGAEILFAGSDSETRRQTAEQLARERGAALVPPYDDPAIIAGQGTIGLEILGALPSVRAVFVPVGGGGLIAGIATAIKALRPDVRVIGVEPEGAADAGASWRAGRLVELETVDTIADGLRARRIGDLPFAAIRAHVDDFLTVPDDAILSVTRQLLTGAHLVVEPSGAVALAGALASSQPGPLAAVISGGNVAGDLLKELVQARPMAH